MLRLQSWKRWRGFTWIELLVVIAIIAILISLLLAVVHSARDVSTAVSSDTWNKACLPADEHPRYGGDW